MYIVILIYYCNDFLTYTSKLGYFSMSIIYYDLMQYMFSSMLEFDKSTCWNTDILLVDEAQH